MNLYVGNLPHATTDDELKEAFEAYGTVSSAVVIKDKFTGRSRGFGFVEMPDNNEGQAAIDAMHGSSLGGRPLTVNEARPREERPKREFTNRGGYDKGGYGGGGGGNRGGYGGGGFDKGRDERGSY
jgi:RNA recognition motif-containing protein